MDKQELHAKYEAMFCKKVSPRFSNDFEWIQAKLNGEPTKTDEERAAEKEVCGDCKIVVTEKPGIKESFHIGTIETKVFDKNEIENMRRQIIKDKCKKLGKKIVTNGRFWEILNCNEPSNKFGNANKTKYNSAREAENVIEACSG